MTEIHSSPIPLDAGRTLHMNDENPRKSVSRPAGHKLDHQIAGLEDQLSPWWPKWSAIWNQQWADDVYGFWLRYFSWYLVEPWMLCNYGCSCGYFAQEQVAHISYAMMSGGRVLWSIQSMRELAYIYGILKDVYGAKCPLNSTCIDNQACIVIAKMPVFPEKTNSNSGLSFAQVLF